MEMRLSLLANAAPDGAPVISVTIPHNVFPGQVIEVLLGNGRCFDFTVPAGCVPGQVLQVNLTAVTIRACADLSAPMASPTDSKLGGINVVGAKQFLALNKWPVGLQEMFIQSCSKYPLHFFLLDNSGSMATFDVHRLVDSSFPRRARLVRGSRWAELVEMVRFHGQLAQASQSPVEFRFLNDIAPITVGRNDGGVGMQKLMEALNTQPTGGTPLCRHIRDIVIQIQSVEAQLRASNQLAMIVIATDGEASDGDVVQALRPLANLPCWVTVRLCTEDETIDRYWNRVDNQLIEMKIDIIEDFIVEGRQIHQFNPWMTYGEPLHRLREWGIGSKEMDLAQQQPLSPDQMRIVCGMLLFNSHNELPNPMENWNVFLKMIRDANNREPEVWSPYSRGPRHWIFAQDLNLAYSPAYVTACCIYYGMCAFCLPCFW